jgi:hypothetical protein
MRANRWSWILVAASLASCAQPAEEESRFEPVGDMQQLMASIVEPAAEVYWDAVGVIVDAEGEHQMAPATDEEWFAVRSAAYTVAESGNLLMMNGYALDDGAWMTMSRSLIEVGRRAVEAAEARDLDAVFDMGAEVYYVCTNCHATYAAESLRPNDTRTN